MASFRRSAALWAGLLLLGMAGCDSSGIERFPESGTLFLLVRDDNLASQLFQDTAQEMRVTLESATADVSGLTAPWSFLGFQPCYYRDNLFFRGDVASECGGTGLILVADPRTVTFHLSISRVDLHRALAPLLPATGDYDGDGVLNGGDNCPLIANPPDPTTGEQADVNSDGVGDACSYTDPLGGIQPDQDKDGSTDPSDNCVATPNPPDSEGIQPDADGDFIGDACEQVVNVLLPTGQVRVDCPAQFTPSSTGSPTYFVIAINEADAISCTPSHSACTLDASGIKIYQQGTDSTTAQACVAAR